MEQPMVKIFEPSRSQLSPGKVRIGASEGSVRLPAALLLFLAAVTLIALAGCEDSARHPVAYRPVSIAAPARPNLPPLPLTAARWRASSSLAPIQPDGVELLARQAEAALEAGEQSFQAGDVSAARAEFNDGLAALQASGFDVQSEPRLALLFDRLVETAHNDEAITSQRAGASGQTGQPSASDELSGIGFSSEGIPEGPVDPTLRTSAEGEVQNVPHDLPLTVNDSVLAFLNFFQRAKGRAVVETGLRRAGRYRPMIERVLREEGLPSDLMYMAQAESAFQPQALSSAGARGLWQFMSFRGKEYGLEHSWWVDDRQDPEKATRAAAHHLRDLYQMFGDWYLAMAAYDSGPGAVQRAVERTGYADFWELYKRNALPKETRNYVPIILALTLIAKDPARYGMEVEPEAPLRTDTVELNHAVDLRLVADTLDVDLDTIRSLNPQLLRLVTPQVPSFALHLPEGTADEFTAAMDEIPPDKWLSWRRHNILEGETLSGIAAKYRVSVSAVADTNNLDPHDALKAGDKLIIPVAPQVQAGIGKIVRYRVRMGDTLETVADEFDVTPAEVKKWNHLRIGKLTRGTRLTIYPGGVAPPAAGAPSSSARASAAGPVKVAHREAGERVESGQPKAVAHRVVSGETLWSIAKAYSTTVEALRSGNKFLFSRPLQAGDTLMILPPR